MKILITIALVCLGFVYSVPAQEKETEKTDTLLKQVVLARNDSDGNIVENPESFFTSDVPIICYVDLRSEKPTVIKAEFIAVKAKGIRPNSVVTWHEYKTKEGEIGAAFDAKPKKQWAAGSYQVSIYLDGVLVKKIAFEVKAAVKD